MSCDITRELATRLELITCCLQGVPQLAAYTAGIPTGDSGANRLSYPL
jgi:hypothetical protein